MEKLGKGDKRWREIYNICSVIKRCLFIAWIGITNLSRMQFHFRPSLVGPDKKRSSAASKYLLCPSRLCCCDSLSFEKSSTDSSTFSKLGQHGYHDSNNSYALLLVCVFVVGRRYEDKNNTSRNLS